MSGYDEHHVIVGEAFGVIEILNFKRMEVL